MRGFFVRFAVSALRKRWRVLTKDYQIYSVEHNRAYYPYRCTIDRVEENGLTTLESDVIITSENIRRSFGDKVATLEEAISKADPIVANAFKKNEKYLKIVDAHYKTTEEQTAHFSVEEGGISFDIDEDAQPSDDNRKQFQTYFYETGHNLDYVIGERRKMGGLASTTYRSPNYTEEKIYYDNKGNVVGRSIKHLSFDEMIKKEGREFIGVYRQIVEKRTKKKASKKETYKEIFKDFKDEPLVNRRQLSDILDGITDGEMLRMGYSLGASHTERNIDYWKKHKVGEEAFAHFTSAISINREVEEMLAGIFSKSYEIFKEIMRL